MLFRQCVRETVNTTSGTAQDRLRENCVYYLFPCNHETEKEIRAYVCRKSQNRIAEMPLNKNFGTYENSVLFQKGLYYTFFFGIISFILVLVALFLLYVTCSKKYRLNWFEKNLLEREHNFDLGRIDNEVASVVTECELGSNRSISNLPLEKKFWIPLRRSKSNSSVIGEGPVAALSESRNSITSFTDPNSENEAQPIARSDKQVVLCTTKPARPRVSSMNTKLDHTKIDSALYQEVSRKVSVETTSGSVNISVSYDQASGILSLRLIQARDLLPRDFSGTSNPYAKIRLLPDLKNVWQTRIHKKTTNPVFDEDFVFEVPSFALERRTLEIILYEFDAYSRHLSLGEVRLPLSEFDLSEKITIWKALEPCSEAHDKVELGDILVTLSFLQSAERLTVVVNKARNLRVVDDTRHSSDPFVKVSLIQDGKRIKKKKTSVQRNDVNPVFNESVTFDVVKENLVSLSIEFSVHHDNKFGGDEFLGKTTLGLGSSQPSDESQIPLLFGRKPLLVVSCLCGIIGKEDKKERESTREEVLHNVALATIALKDGNIEKSGKMLLEVLDLAEANDFPLGVVSACDMLSSLAIKIGDYERAENLLIKALDNLHNQGAPADDNYVVSFNLKLSRLYSNNGNDDLAESGFKNCLNLQRKKLNANVDEETFLLWTTTLYWYGKFLLNKKRFQEAKSCFRDCYLTSLKVGNILPNQIMVILYNLGEVCQILGDHDEAIEFLLEAVSLDRKCKNPDLSYFYSKLGSISMHKGLYNEAKLWCDQAHKFAVKYRNPDAEQESNACLEQLHTFFVT